MGQVIYLFFKYNLRFQCNIYLKFLMECVMEIVKMNLEYIQSSDCLIKELLIQNIDGDLFYQIVIYFIVLCNEYFVFGIGIDNILM